MTIATEAQIEAFLKVLDPEDDSTGGGAASAVAGAMAAGLAGMVARVSTGKPDMESDEFYDEIDGRAQTLTRELLAGAADDSTAFEAVMAGFRMPKDTDGQKAAHRDSGRSRSGDRSSAGQRRALYRSVEARRAPGAEAQPQRGFRPRRRAPTGAGGARGLHRQRGDQPGQPEARGGL